MSSNHRQPSPPEVGRLLVRAYPEVLSSTDGDDLYWYDGSTMAIGRATCQAQANVAGEASSLVDQFSSRYPLGDEYVFGELQSTDPGRTRNLPFFKKMYGASKEAVESNLVAIQWMPKSRNRRILVTRVNGVDRQLAKVSSDLEKLPRALRKFCAKVCGTFNWRKITGADQLSAHAFGIAIDINVARSDYWQWDLEKHGKMDFENRFPREVVEVFERHGFIWGGKWKHYDSMHFEYRPELFMAAEPSFGAAKVLFLSRQPNSYGAERQLRYLAEGLSSERFLPIIIHAEVGADEDSTASLPEVECAHIAMRPWRKFSNVLTRYLDAFSLLRHAREQQVQVIHCSYQWLLPYASFVARRMGIPLVGHIRRPNNGLRKLRSLGCHKCDAVIAISNRIKSELLQLNTLKDKVHLISDTVELVPCEELSGSALRDELKLNGQFVFGLVGRIYKSKRQLDFAKAAKLLLDKHHDAQFVIIGRVDDEKYHRELTSFLESNCLTDKVHLLGHRDDVAQLLPSIDVLVSLAGGSIMYEAMAAGRTVISAGFTKPEESTHLIDGVNSLVTESKDVHVLAALMERTLTEPELCNQLGVAAQEYAQSRFPATTMVRATELIYDSLLTSR